MRGATWASALVGLIAGQAGAQPPAAQAPPPQAPRWHVDGGGDRCLLTRPFDAATTVILRVFPLSGDYELMLARADWPGSAARVADGATIVLSPDMKRFERRGAVVPLGAEVGKAIAFGGLPPDFVSALAVAKTLSVAAGGRALAELPVPGSAKAALDALRQCEAVKAVDWGADPAAFQPGGALPKPVGDPGKWLDIRDIGAPNTWSAFGAGAAFRLVVGPAGTVERCDVLEASLNSALRANGCKSLTAHARYEPARDAQGRPVRAVLVYSTSYQVTVTYEIH
jgi:hypothetical protein